MFFSSNDILLCSPVGKPPGYDRVRNAEIGNKDFELDVLEEAYSSEHWIVRIFKVRLGLLIRALDSPDIQGEVRSTHQSTG